MPLLFEPRGPRSVALPHVARQDVQLGAVLGHGAAGDGDAALCEDFDDFLVAESGLLVSSSLTRSAMASLTLVLLIDSPLGGLVAGGEEIFHLEDALRRGDVFAGDGAADGGLVHADGLGDLHHGHRLEGGAAELEEILLPLDDLVGDVRDGLLALVDALDEEFAAADFVADVVLHLGAAAVLRHQVLVGVADAQVRDLVAVEGDLVIAADLLHVDIGQDVVVRVRGENLAGLRDRAWR